MLVPVLRAEAPDCFRAERSRDRGGVVLQREWFRPVSRHKSTILFFVRVNQVLVRLWMRVIGLLAVRRWLSAF